MKRGLLILLLLSAGTLLPMAKVHSGDGILPLADLGVESPEWREHMGGSEFLRKSEVDCEGLCLVLHPLRDTLLVREPVLVEIRLVNDGTEPHLDAILFDPGDSRLRLYVITPDSTAIQLAPAYHVNRIRPAELEIGPGESVGGIFSAGAFCLRFSSFQWSFQVPRDYFMGPGSYRLVAAYAHEHVQGEGDDRKRVTLASNVCEVNVVEPENDEIIVLERIGRRRPCDVPLEDLRRLREDHPRSVYSPYLLAIEAHRLAEVPGDNTRYLRSIPSLCDFIERYPAHPMREAVEYDIITILGRLGEIEAAERRLVEFRTAFPQSVMHFRKSY